MPPINHNAAWSHDELVLALYLYCQIPFAKTKANNPDVIQLAHRLGRTPSSVARKLGNFGAFDPLLATRGISGLTHYSRADEEIWRAYYQNWDRLVEDSERLLKARDPISNSIKESIQSSKPYPEGTERLITATQRVGQSFFRRSVLSSYDYICCICGLDMEALLVGSHIIPWSVQINQRTDPQNGLCLCALHDRAFDCGLLAITTAFEIVVSERVAKSRNNAIHQFLTSFSGQPMRQPRRFAPRIENLKWHLEHVFKGQ